METVGTVTPTVTVDCRGSSCPLPVVKTAQAMKDLAPGQVLLVLATDSGVEPDMKAWASRTGNALLGIDREGDVYRVLLRRA